MDVDWQSDSIPDWGETRLSKYFLTGQFQCQSAKEMRFSQRRLLSGKLIKMRYRENEKRVGMNYKASLTRYNFRVQFAEVLGGEGLYRYHGLLQRDESKRARADGGEVLQQDWRHQDRAQGERVLHIGNIYATTNFIFDLMFKTWIRNFGEGDGGEFQFTSLHCLWVQSCEYYKKLHIIWILMKHFRSILLIFFDQSSLDWHVY